jgi:hypothetical protein
VEQRTPGSRSSTGDRCAMNIPRLGAPRAVSLARDTWAARRRVKPRWMPHLLGSPDPKIHQPQLIAATSYCAAGNGTSVVTRCANGASICSMSAIRRCSGALFVANQRPGAAGQPDGRLSPTIHSRDASPTCAEKLWCVPAAAMLRCRVPDYSQVGLRRGATPRSPATTAVAGASMSSSSPSPAALPDLAMPSPPAAPAVAQQLRLSYLLEPQLKICREQLFSPRRSRCAGDEGGHGEHT